MRLAAHHDHWRGDSCVLQVFEQSEAIAARHDHIAQDQIEGLCSRQFKSPCSVVAYSSLMPSQPKGTSQRSQRVGLIVHNENVCLHISHSSALDIFASCAINSSFALAFANKSTNAAPPP